MDNIVIDKTYPDGYRVTIGCDEHAENPRYDNDCYLGNIIMFSGRYSIGDKVETDDPKQLVRDLIKEGAIILPIYLYDHSGVTIRTRPFSCPWDSGFAGVIVATRERIRKQMDWNRITKYRRMQVEEYLIGEVNELNNYLTGEMYFFEIEYKGESIDSCYGFNGSECITEETGYMWTEHIHPTIEYDRKKRFENRITKIKTLIKAKAPLQVRQHQMELMP